MTKKELGWSKISSQSYFSRIRCSHRRSQNRRDAVRVIAYQRLLRILLHLVVVFDLCAKRRSRCT
eukprot:1229350-Pleurochrysis_carterae.AAC.1